MRTFHIVNVRLKANDRGNYSVPDFAVFANDADEAIDIASRIVLCDRRTSDGHLYTLTGSVQEHKDFSITMSES